MPLESAALSVVGLSGSLAEASSTRRALLVALDGARTAGARVELLDLRDFRLPFAGSDWTPDEFPDALRLNETLRAASAILWATPEYHGSFSGVLKNALDLGGFDEYGGKMIGLIGVAGGQIGAINALSHMRTVARQLHAWVLPHQVSVARAHAAFDAEGKLRDAKLQASLTQLGRDAVHFARLHQTPVPAPVERG